MVQGRKEEKFEIARNLMGIGIPLHQITAVTGLTAEELENCK